MPADIDFKVPKNLDSVYINTFTFAETLIWCSEWKDGFIKIWIKKGSIQPCLYCQDSTRSLHWHTKGCYYTQDNSVGLPTSVKWDRYIWTGWLFFRSTMSRTSIWRELLRLWHSITLFFLTTSLPYSHSSTRIVAYFKWRKQNTVCKHNTYL